MRNKSATVKKAASVMAAVMFTSGTAAALETNLMPDTGLKIEPVSQTINNGSARPNIVFVLLDDTGVRDLSCYGNTFNETPNIDKVAEDGILFSNYYASAVCSPSRSALYTGRNPARTMITDYLDNLNSMYLSPDEFTAFPKVLQQQGYYTALLGKWHLCAGYENYPTNGAPVYHGFNEVIMSEQRYIGPGYYFYPYYHLPQIVGREQGKYLVDDMNEQAIDFIERANETGQPFFLMFSHYATHTTLEAPQETVEKYQKKRGSPGSRDNKEQNPYLAAMLEHVDRGVGMIDDKLEELGIKDNTILIISSDNGGSGEFTTNGELRGAKRMIHEGGIKDPLIIRWPKGMKESKKGTVNDTPVSIIDFYQTFCEVAGAKLEEIPENDGESLLPILTGNTSIDRDKDLYWVIWRNSTNADDPSVTYKSNLHEGAAIRRGNYKYIESQASYRRELYDLEADPSETTNLINTHPEVYAVLARELNQSLEKDTYGKKLSITFADKEYYRMNIRGTFTKSNNRYSASSGFNVMTVENWWLYDSWTQVDVRARNKGRAGIVFRANLNAPSANSFESYAAVINTDTKKVELLRVKADNVYVIASADAPSVQVDKSHTLKVWCDSDQIKIYLDGSNTPILECYDQRLFKGTFGVISDGATAEFKNFEVEGFEGVRPVSDRQLQLIPPDEVKVKIDDRYIWFDAPTQIINREVYVDLENIVEELGIGLNKQGDTYTLTLGGFTVQAKVGQNSAVVNGEVQTVPPIIAIDGRAMVPLSNMKNWFLIDQIISGNVINLSCQQNTIIDDKDSRIKYVGTWQAVSSQTAYGSSLTRTNTSGSYAELKFAGMGIRLYLGVGSTSGVFEVYIDGQKIGDQYIAYNSTTQTRVVKFEKLDLSLGEHTIKVVWAGKHEGNTGYLNIDAFEVIKFT